MTAQNDFQIAMLLFRKSFKNLPFNLRTLAQSVGAERSVQPTKRVRSQTKNNELQCSYPTQK